MNHSKRRCRWAQTQLIRHTRLLHKAGAASPHLGATAPHWGPFPAAKSPGKSTWRQETLHIFIWVARKFWGAGEFANTDSANHGVDRTGCLLSRLTSALTSHCGSPVPLPGPTRPGRYPLTCFEQKGKQTGEQNPLLGAGMESQAGTPQMLFRHLNMLDSLLQKK